MLDSVYRGLKKWASTTLKIYTTDVVLKTIEGKPPNIIKMNFFTNLCHSFVLSNLFYFFSDVKYYLSYILRIYNNYSIIKSSRKFKAPIEQLDTSQL